MSECEVEQLREAARGADEAGRALVAELMRVEAERDAMREVVDAAQNLYERSLKCWEDDADDTPGHVRDLWLWAAWIDEIETTGAALARLDAAREKAIRAH